MKKSIFTTLIILLACTCFAKEGKDKANKSAKGNVKSEIVDHKSFNVGNLKACQVEASDEDGIMEYKESVELLTEEIEEGEVVKF